MVKIANRKPLLLTLLRPLLALAVFAVSFILINKHPVHIFANGEAGKDGVKSSVSMHWIDRATVGLDNVNLDDDDSGRVGWHLSDEASALYYHGSAAIFNTALNATNMGNDYKDENIFDGENYFNRDNCRDKTTIVFDEDYGTGSSKGALGIDTLVFRVDIAMANIEGVGENGSCQMVTSSNRPFLGNSGANIRLIGPVKNDNDARSIWFRFEPGNNDKIKRVDGRQTYQRTNPPAGTDPNNPQEKDKLKTFYIDDAGGVKPNDTCDGLRTRVVFQDDLADTSKKDLKAKFYTCDEAGVLDVVVHRDGNEGSSKQIVNKPTDSTGASGAPKTDCEVKLSNPLTWLMCPIISAATLAVNTLDNAITSQLYVQTGQGSIYDESTPSGKALFNTWASFRYIALGILVIIGLIMIISQALNFGIFDAYTIKKIMPKILIGIVGISVSWYLCKFAIDFFNDLGVGVRSLLYGPFKDVGTVRFDQGATSLLGVGAGVAVVGLGLIGVLSFVATALLAVIIAFAILVFRQIIIILLVVTAPLAIICWILPNTERVWKMWWDFFLRALVVFPIIALFIAGGRVIAAIATVNAVQSGQSNFLASCIAFIAYFGPYFALPAAFRLAGGAIATVGGMANDRSRGVFDRLKKGRQERYADRMQRAKNEKLYNPNNAALKKWTNTKVGKVLNPNKMATWTAAPGKNAQYAARGLNIPGLSAAGRRLESDIHASSMEQSEKWLQHVNKHGANDKFYRAVGGMYKSFEDDTKRKLIDQGFATAEIGKDGNYDLSTITAKGALKSEDDFKKVAHIMAASSSDSEQKAAVALEANAAYTAGMYTDPEMNYASTAVGGAMGLAAHGFFNPDDAADAGNLIASKNETGSVDFAHAAVVQAEAIGASKNPDVKPGYGHVIEDVKDASGKKIGQRFKSGNKDAGRSWGALETFASGDFAQAKGAFFKDGRMGGKIKELLVATGKDEAAASAQKAKWHAELVKEGVDPVKAHEQIKKRIAQRDAIVGELQQVTSAYSQAPIDSRTRAQEIMNEFGIPPLGGIDPDAARGGGGGGGGGGAGGGGIIIPGAPTPPDPGGGGLILPK